MKKAAKIIGIILAVLVAIPLVLLLIVSIRTALTQDDYSAVYTDPKNDSGGRSQRFIAFIYVQ